MAIDKYLWFIKLLFEITEITTVPAPAMHKSDLEAANIEISFAGEESLKLAVITVAIYCISGPESLQNLKHRRIDDVSRVKNCINIMKNGKNVYVELGTVLPVGICYDAYLHAVLMVPAVLIAIYLYSSSIIPHLHCFAESNSYNLL